MYIKSCSEIYNILGTSVERRDGGETREKGGIEDRRKVKQIVKAAGNK